MLSNNPVVKSESRCPTSRDVHLTLRGIKGRTPTTPTTYDFLWRKSKPVWPTSVSQCGDIMRLPYDSTNRASALPRLPSCLARMWMAHDGSMESNSQKCFQNRQIHHDLNNSSTRRTRQQVHVPASLVPNLPRIDELTNFPFWGTLFRQTPSRHQAITVLHPFVREYSFW